MDIAHKSRRFHNLKGKFSFDGISRILFLNSNHKNITSSLNRGSGYLRSNGKARLPKPRHPALYSFKQWMKMRGFRFENMFLASLLLWLAVNVSVFGVKYFHFLVSQPIRQQKNFRPTLQQRAKKNQKIGVQLAPRRNSLVPRIIYLKKPSRPEKRPSWLSPAISILARRVPLLIFKQHKVEENPSKFSDKTQLYPIMDSSDSAIKRYMKLREPHVQGECIPMKDWQTAFYPTCNFQHEFYLLDTEAVFLGENSYWRDGWKIENSIFGDSVETVALKMHKYRHRFEEKYFEHNRIDAIAMERLTSSKHVVDIYSHCGNSVLMELEDKQSFLSLADKARGSTKIRLAQDIAEGIADIHSIDGSKYATLTHFNINLSNVVVVNGTIKLKDFSIAALRKWNTTSDQPCGFSSRFPDPGYANPLLLSPEETEDSQFLTEKVDVYAMGIIFFQLICPVAPKSMKSGKELVIPPFVFERTDFATVALRDAMLAACTSSPNKRPSARDIAHKLHSALKFAKDKEREVKQRRRKKRRKDRPSPQKILS